MSKTKADGRRLAELARLFLKLGSTAFGGPAAHIAMMEHEVVRRRQWLTREEFLDLLCGLGKAALKSGLLAVLGVAAVTANFLGTHELLVLFVGGVILALIQTFKRKTGPAKLPTIAIASFFKPPTLAAVAATGATAGATAPFGLWPLFLFFLKVGSVLYGSGYVLLAFLRGDLVERFGWLTESQLLDAIAVGQMIPGPVFTTAAFIGYVLGRLPAAIIAMMGIFLPAFFFVAVSGPLIPRLRRSAIAGAVLDGVNVASLALMAVVTWRLAPRPWWIGCPCCSRRHRPGSSSDTNSTPSGSSWAVPLPVC